MSLILDALRKADAERERGSVPGLHSQPVVASSEAAPRKPAPGPRWIFIALGAGAGVVLALAATWVIVGRDSPRPVIAERGSVSPPAAPAPMTPAAPAAIGAPPAPAAAPLDGQPAAQPAPWPTPDDRKGARVDARADAPMPAGSPVLTGDPNVYSRDQLPPHIRSALPQFTIGGSIYSPNPAGRSLIVNGQLYRERDRLTQELALEEIRLKAAIFSFRGYRFEVLF